MRRSQWVLPLAARRDLHRRAMQALETTLVAAGKRMETLQRQEQDLSQQGNLRDHLVSTMQARLRSLQAASYPCLVSCRVP